MTFQLTLEEQEVNVVLSALGKLPLETALDPWMKIRTQANQQVVEAQRAQAARSEAGPEAPPNAD